MRSAFDSSMWLNDWARFAYYLVPREEYKQMQEKQLDHIFRYHPPKGNQTDRYQYIRREAKKLAQTVINLCPPSREQSIALTKIQEAVMMANAAIAINEDRDAWPVTGVAYMSGMHPNLRIPPSQAAEQLAAGHTSIQQTPIPGGETALPPAPERPVEPEPNTLKESDIPETQKHTPPIDPAAPFDKNTPPDDLLGGDRQA